MVPKYLCLEDCKAVINSCTNSNDKVCRFEIEPYSKDLLGNRGEHFLLKVHLKSGEKFTFFAKELSDSKLPALFSDTCFFEKELFVFNLCATAKKIFPRLDVSVVPKMFHNKHGKVLVLENLAEKGFETISSDFDKAHMFAAIEALAKFHAISISYEELRGKIEGIEELENSIWERRENSSSEKFVSSGQIGAFKLADLLYNKCRGEVFKGSYLRLVRDAYYYLNEGGAQFRRVVCHGDTWIKNALFRYKNSKPVGCVWVDFEDCCFAPPAYDLTALVYCCGGKYDLHMYYEYYYNALGVVLEELGLDVDKVLPVHEFHKTCQLYMPCSMLFRFLWRQITESDSAFLKLFNDQERSRQVVLGSQRAAFVEKMVHEDKTYCGQLMQRMDDLADYWQDSFVSLNDCYKITRGTGKVEKYSTAKFRQRAGFLGEHYSLEIVVAGNPASYFLKLPPQTESQRKVTDGCRVFYKEARFFSKIVPDLCSRSISGIAKVIPKCHIAYEDMLVFEDLADLGYSVKDKRTSLDLQTFKLGLTALAKLHASGIVVEEVTGRKLIDVYQREFKEAFYNEKGDYHTIIQAIGRGIEEEINLLSNYTTNITPQQFISSSKALLGKLPDFVKPSKLFRNTICHGDLLSSNLMFNCKQQSAKIVDFQSFRYSPPAADLMQYLYLSTDRLFRSKHYGEVLDYYYKMFEQNLSDYGCDVSSILNYEDFLESTRQEKLFAILQTASFFQIIMLNAEQMDALFSDPDLQKQFTFISRADFIRKNILSDPVYRRRCEEAILDLREMCEYHAKYNKWRS